MDKKEFSVSLLVIGLTILFAVAAFALFLSRGKSKFWTAKKMKLGALILSLSTITTTAFQSCCYKPEPLNYINLELANDTINLNESSLICGSVYLPQSDIYSFKLTNDSVSSVYQCENIIPLDSIFDEDSEEFEINLDKTLKSGRYSLHFYDVDKTLQETSSPLHYAYSLEILNDLKTKKTWIKKNSQYH